jgi:adenylate cyclase, class 2
VIDARDPPRRNVELKAHDLDPPRSLRVCLGLGAEDCGWLHQRDTYFRVPSARLKLREQNGTAEMIYYERRDVATERESHYQIATVGDANAMKKAMAAKFGVLVVVEKARHLLLRRTIRVHLDEVRGLGSFIELEAVTEPDSEPSGEYRNIAELRKALGITDARVLAGGYSDELLRVSAGVRP